jgi:hypothetical protein
MGEAVAIRRSIENAPAPRILRNTVREHQQVIHRDADRGHSSEESENQSKAAEELGRDRQECYRSRNMSFQQRDAANPCLDL